MTEGITVIGRLRELSEENEDLSHKLLQVERDLEPVQRDYDDFISDYEIGLWQRAQDEEGFKLPAEALRIKLAQRAMPPELLGRHRGLLASRDRLKTRIAHVKTAVEAQRSILSAMKEGLV